MAWAASAICGLYLFEIRTFTELDAEQGMLPDLGARALGSGNIRISKIKPVRGHLQEPALIVSTGGAVRQIDGIAGVLPILAFPTHRVHPPIAYLAFWLPLFMPFVSNDIPASF
jgi:hypothetical protein